MRSRRHLRAVRATLALWAVDASCAATNARVWVRHHRRAGARIPPGVQMLVGPEPDGAPGTPPDVIIDLTALDRVDVGSEG